MAWSELTRRQHDRVGNKYASDLTDAEWALLEPLMPPRKTTGRPRTTRLREVFDAILYIATTGCQSLPERGRMLPNDFPPVSTVRGYFYAWRDDGLLDEMNGKLVESARLADGRIAQPTAGVIDSQSVKITESGGVSGYDAGKRIKGRKRHIVTDTIGLLVGLKDHSAGIQDRDGAPDVLEAVAARYPMLRHIFADGGYAGPKLRDALKAIGRWTVSVPYSVSFAAVNAIKGAASNRDRSKFHRRSRVNWRVMRQREAVASSIGRRRRSGTRSVRPAAPRWPSWSRTTFCATMFRIVWPA